MYRRQARGKPYVEELRSSIYHTHAAGMICGICIEAWMDVDIESTEQMRPGRSIARRISLTKKLRGL